MAAAILDGKFVSLSIKDKVKQRIESSLSQGMRPPCLAVILLGETYASQLYVTHKRKACYEVGIKPILYSLSAHTTEAELLSVIDTLNNDKDIDGILVQLPLPTHIQTPKIIEHIDPNKDVDGFHPLNLGRLAQGQPQLRPCTPWGIMQLLSYYNLSVSSLSALVVGASSIVGRPMALELLLAKATVTISHSKTKDLEHYVRQADIIVSATGIPNVISPSWLSKKQIIIDVGIHRTKTGIISGDIDFTQAQALVSWITPVPGGVGPMTVATLLENTVFCWIKAMS